MNSSDEERSSELLSAVLEERIATAALRETRKIVREPRSALLHALRDISIASGSTDDHRAANGASVTGREDGDNFSDISVEFGRAMASTHSNRALDTEADLRIEIEETGTSDIRKEFSLERKAQDLLENRIHTRDAQRRPYPMAQPIKFPAVGVDSDISESEYNDSHLGDNGTRETIRRVAVPHLQRSIQVDSTSGKSSLRKPVKHNQERNREGAGHMDKIISRSEPAPLKEDVRHDSPLLRSSQRPASRAGSSESSAGPATPTSQKARLADALYHVMGKTPYPASHEQASPRQETRRNAVLAAAESERQGQHAYHRSAREPSYFEQLARRLSDREADEQPQVKRKAGGERIETLTEPVRDTRSESKNESSHNPERVARVGLKSQPVRPPPAAHVNVSYLDDGSLSVDIGDALRACQDKIAQLESENHKCHLQMVKVENENVSLRKQVRKEDYDWSELISLRRQNAELRDTVKAMKEHATILAQDLDEQRKCVRELCLEREKYLSDLEQKGQEISSLRRAVERLKDGQRRLRMALQYDRGRVSTGFGKSRLWGPGDGTSEEDEGNKATLQETEQFSLPLSPPPTIRTKNYHRLALDRSDYPPIRRTSKLEKEPRVLDAELGAHDLNDLEEANPDPPPEKAQSTQPSEPRMRSTGRTGCLLADALDTIKHHIAPDCGICEQPLLVKDIVAQPQPSNGDVRIEVQRRKKARDAGHMWTAKDGSVPPETVLSRVLRELEDEYDGLKSQYEDISRELAFLPKGGPAQTAVRRSVRAKRNDLVERIEQRGDQILNLYNLLHFEDRAVSQA